MSGAGGGAGRSAGRGASCSGDWVGVCGGVALSVECGGYWLLAVTRVISWERCLGDAEVECRG